MSATRPKSTLEPRRRKVADVRLAGVCLNGGSNYFQSARELNAAVLLATSISMAKAITSAYMPLGAITVPEHVYQAMIDESKKLGVFAHDLSIPTA